jgi:O-antigen/teichoic acid export membrane protein
MTATRAWVGSAAVNLVNLGTGVATGVLAARLLMPEGRGELAEVIFWSGLAASLGICSMPAALTMGLSRDRSDRTLAANALLLAALLSVVTVAAAWVVISLTVPPHLRWLVLAYTAAFVPLNLLSLTLLGIDHGNQNFTRYNLFRLLPQAVYLVAILGLLAAGQISVTTLVAATWLGTLVVFALRASLLGRDIRWRFDPHKIWALLRTGLSYHTAALTGLLFQQADRFVLVGWFDHGDLGLYAVAMTLSGAGIGIVSGATAIVLFPKLAAATDPAVRHRQISLAMGTTLFLATAINGALAAAVPWLLPLLFGPAFVGAVPVTLILCLAQIPASYVAVATLALRAVDDWRAAPYAHLWALGGFTLVMPLLIESHTLHGVALAILAGHIVSMMWVVTRLRARTGLDRAACLLPSPATVVTFLPRLGWRFPG